MIERTCCVTGHRKIPEGKKDYVAMALKKEILAAIADGYTRFISGGAEGVDLIFAAIVVELKEQGHPLYLEMDVPYLNRLKSKDPLFQRVLAVCDNLHVMSDSYSRGCFFARNRHVVEESSRVIAVYDGRTSGGTFYTMQYAYRQGKEVRLIKL